MLIFLHTILSVLSMVIINLTTSLSELLARAAVVLSVSQHPVVVCELEIMRERVAACQLAACQRYSSSEEDDSSSLLCGCLTADTLLQVSASIDIMLVPT